MPTRRRNAPPPPEGPLDSPGVPGAGSGDGAGSGEGPGNGDGPGRDWLLLIYRVPSEPTRLRATVWRRLRTMGAVYLQNSVAAMPATPAAERALRRLRHEIIEMSGSAVLLSCDALVGHAEVLAAFQSARDDEYEEIVDRCRDFLAQVEKEHVAEHFTFAELEENEVDLVKLQSWLEKIRARDTFGAPGGRQAEQAVADCVVALEGYAARVYETEAEAH